MTTDQYTLEELPTIIFNAKNQLAYTNQLVNDLTKALSDMDAQFDQMIADDSSLKNAESRKAKKGELRLGVKAYVATLTELNQCTRQRDNQRNELDLYLDLFKVAQLKIAYATGELYHTQTVSRDY